MMELWWLYVIGLAVFYVVVVLLLLAGAYYCSKD